MFRNIRQRISGKHLTLRTKLVLSFSGIAVVLLISSIISIMEYRRMSHYLSELIADNINSINVAQATVAGLRGLKRPDDIARLRGKTPEEAQWISQSVVDNFLLMQTNMKTKYENCLSRLTTYNNNNHSQCCGTEQR